MVAASPGAVTVCVFVWGMTVVWVMGSVVEAVDVGLVVTLVVVLLELSEVVEVDEVVDVERVVMDVVVRIIVGIGMPMDIDLVGSKGLGRRGGSGGSWRAFSCTTSRY